MVGVGWPLIPWAMLGLSSDCQSFGHNGSAIYQYNKVFMFVRSEHGSLGLSKGCGRDVGARFPRVPVFTHLMLTKLRACEPDCNTSRTRARRLATNTLTPTPRQHTVSTAARRDSLKTA